VATPLQTLGYAAQVSPAETTTLQLEVLGAGPAYTNRPGATGAAYLLRHGPTALLLDLGQGSFPRLAQAIEPSMLDAVAISHLHPDHFIDLVVLRHYLRWEFDPPRRVRVVAPAGLATRLDALHDEPGFTAGAFDVEDVTSGSRTVGTLTLEARPVTHTRDSHAYRVAIVSGSGPGLVYSGDCGRAEDLDALIRAGDTLLSEVSFGPGPVPPGAEHLDGPAVGALAQRTGVGRVLLTHLQMGYDEAATLETVRAAFDGPVGFVGPGSRLAIEG
jgi:ribonuclease BN (tRNA processing enzyme)